jgi:hypothetical protein
MPDPVSPAPVAPPVAAPVTPRPSAIQKRPGAREVPHKPVPGSDRATKEAIGGKIADRLQQVHDEGVTDGKNRIGSHFNPNKKKGARRTVVETSPEPEQVSPAATETADKPTSVSATAGETDKKEIPPVPGEEAETAAAPATAILPEAHRRSLKNFGWTDEEIDESLKTGGGAFLNTAAKIHDQRSKEIQAYARAGQKFAQTQQPQQAPVPAAIPQGSMVDRVMQKNTALKKAYPGNDALFDSMVSSELDMARMLDGQRQAQQQAQLDLHMKQVDGFFGAPAMKSYEQHYGTTFGAATPEQTAHRDQVINTAAYIIHGARAQGVDLDLSSALQMAHDATAAPIAKAAARQEILSEVQQRAAGLTQKNQAGPRGSSAENSKGPPTRQELLKRTGSRLAAAGLRRE